MGEEKSFPCSILFVLMKSFIGQIERERKNWAGKVVEGIYSRDIGREEHPIFGENTAKLVIQILRTA